MLLCVGFLVAEAGKDVLNWLLSGDFYFRDKFLLVYKIFAACFETNEFITLQKIILNNVIIEVYAEPVAQDFVLKATRP
ncbi:MAG: hypothetical protein U0V49_09150 [Saprospiraceae bacterium]